MLTDKKYLRLAEGSTGVSYHGLAKKKVLLVCRDGFSYDITRGIIGSPDSRQVQYIFAWGIFDFATPGNPGGESILIWYAL